jgi:hypothetical protein
MTKSSAHFWATFIHGYDCALILAENGLGSILGGLFTSSSGHPDSETDVAHESCGSGQNDSADEN